MSMEALLGLQGKTAIVWGGGAGMGLATAKRLSEAGCRVAIVDQNLQCAEQAARQLEVTGATAIALQADATIEAQVNQAVEEAAHQLGSIDVMVTVIGIGVWSSLLDMTEAQLDDAIRLNLKSFFFPARAVARSIMNRRAVNQGQGDQAQAKQEQSASILCVASISGMTSAPNHAGYGAAKAGMINMVRTMAVEWGPHNIRVNAIAPGAIVTARVQPDEHSLARMKGLFPLGRPGDADEIAKAALFLSSDLASYVTGHTLPVDGGWTSTFLTHAAGTGNNLTRGN